MKFSKGHIPWNKGLTKETSEVLKIKGENHSKVMTGRKNSVESNIKRSMTIKKLVRNGTHNFLYLSKTSKRRKQISDFMKLQTGELGHNWKNGKSFEEYPPQWNEQLRKEIRERDKHRCQKCFTFRPMKKIHVHHIDYNKQNSDKNNLISLCQDCHSTTNGNRIYWKWQFQVFMNLFHNANNQIDWSYRK